MLTKDHSKYVVECDECLETLETGETEFDAALIVIRNAGWNARKTKAGWQNICPDHEQ